MYISLLCIMLSWRFIGREPQGVKPGSGLLILCTVSNHYAFSWVGFGTTQAPKLEPLQ